MQIRFVPLERFLRLSHPITHDFALLTNPRHLLSQRLDFTYGLVSLHVRSYYPLDLLENLVLEYLDLAVGFV